MGNASACFSTRILIMATSLMLPLAAPVMCQDKAGCGYGIDPLLLKAIAWKESRSQAGAVGPKLEDDNRALDLMQVNVIHLSDLAHLGIRREHLLDVCTPQRMGTWILADCIQRFGTIWKPVGCYYAGPTSTNVSAQVEYIRGVQRLHKGYRRQQAHQISTSPTQVTSLQGD